jgi:hypothetical protein
MKLGSIVSITFSDHVERDGVGELGPIDIECIGRLIAITPKTYELASWLNADGTADHNSKVFSILKSVILKKKVLK